MTSIRRHRRVAADARRTRLASAAAAVALLGGCRAPPVEPAAAGALPRGPGRAILERDCTGCHDLGGLRAYRGYYDEPRWRAMIVTMVDHGADLDESEIAVLTSYLVEHFGPDAR